MKYARAHHSATLLPDGRVLVMGGYNKAKQLVASAELFDPYTGLSRLVKLSSSLPRAYHRTTLLADGTILVTGGINAKGMELSDIALVNPRNGIVTTLPIQLKNARYGHNSVLHAGGKVLISGGHGAKGLLVQQSEIIDTATKQIALADTKLATTALSGSSDFHSQTSLLESSLPKDGATDVAIDQALSVSFSQAIDMTSLNEQTVSLMGPNGAVPSTITPAEDGMLVFIVPHQDLLPGTDYTLVIQATDQQAQATDLISIGFKTQSKTVDNVSLVNSNANRSAANNSNPAVTHPNSNNTAIASVLPQNQTAAAAISMATTDATRIMTGAAARVHNVNQPEDDEAWIPQDKHRHGNWHSGRNSHPGAAELLDNDGPMRKKVKAMRARASKSGKNPNNPAIKAPNAIGVTGTVLRINDLPLANVSIIIGSKSVKTDQHGHFELTGIAPGHYEMEVVGSSADHLAQHYLDFVMGVDVQADGITELSHFLYVPRIRDDDWVTIPSPTLDKTIITHPLMPGLELHIPKGTVFRDRQGKIVNRIALVPVPTDRAPYPVPGAFPTYFMLHPGGAMIEGNGTDAAQGIKIVYPNNTNGLPGSQHHLWVYDAQTKGWVIYGHATVSEDGSQVIPDAGVGLHEHMGAGHTAPPGTPPPPKETPDPPCPKAGDPVQCSSGLFFHERTDISIADDIPINITRTYRPGDTQIRPFGKGTNHTYGMYLRAPNANYSQLDLVLPDGPQVCISIFDWDCPSQRLCLATHRYCQLIL